MGDTIAIRREKCLAVIGPMLSHVRGTSITQGEILAAALQENGWYVETRSGIRSRVLRFVDTVLYVVRHYRYDVVILQMYSGLSLVVEVAVTLVVRSFGKTLIMTVHGGDIPKVARSYPLLMRWIFSQADIVTAPSDYLKKELAQYRENIIVIPNIVDIAALPLRDKFPVSPFVLWMRSFSPVYNPEMAIRVFRRLVDALPDVTMVMAGSDLGSHEAVKAMAVRYGLEDRMEFPGYLDEESKRKYGERAQVYICTNRVDNAPVSLLEMSAMGVPIVATRVGGIPVLYDHGKSILLVDDNDDEEMAIMVLKLLSDAGLRNRIIQGGREVSDRHCKSKVVELWGALLVTLFLNTSRVS